MQSFVIFIYTYCGVLLELSVLNIDSGFFEEKKQTAFVGGRDLCMEEISGQQADHFEMRLLTMISAAESDVE